VDVECNMTADMFSIMRTAFTLQRALVNERALAGELNPPSLLTCRDVIEFATIAGARVAHLDRKIGTLAQCLRLVIDVAGACSAKFVVTGAGEEYDAPDIELKRKSRTATSGEYTC